MTNRPTPSERPYFDAEWCRILRDRKVELGISLAALAKQAKVPERTLDRTMNGQRKPDAVEIVGLAQALQLPVLRLLAAVDVIPEMTRLLDYMDQLEDMASRTVISARLVSVDQVYGASVIASKVVASGRYKATIWPLWQGTGRHRRHYADLVAFESTEGGSPVDLRTDLKQLMRAELGWFHSGFIGFPETATGMPTPDLRAVVNVPRFLAIRRGGEHRTLPEPTSPAKLTDRPSGRLTPNSICVVGLHWSGSADVGSFLGYAFDYDSCHIGFVASRVYSRLTDEWENEYFDFDRFDVARTFFYGSQLGRRRVWASGGDQALDTVKLVGDPHNRAPLVVHLRVRDDLIEWSARVRTSKGHTNATLKEDIEGAKKDRAAMDAIIAKIPDRSITLDVRLPEGPDFSDPNEDGRDAFFDSWAELAERTVRQLRERLDLAIDVEHALQRMAEGGRT